MARTKQVARMAFRPPHQPMYAGGLGEQFQPLQNAIVIPMNVENPMNKFREHIASSRNPENADQPEILQHALLFFNRYGRHVTPAERHEMLLLLGTSLLAQDRESFCQFVFKLDTYRMPFDLNKMLSDLSHEDLSVMLHESGISRSLLEQVVSDREDHVSREKILMVSNCMSLLRHEDLWDAFMTLVDHFCVNTRLFGEEMSNTDVDEFTKLSHLISSEFLRCAMTEVEPRVFTRMIASVREYKAKTESTSQTNHFIDFYIKLLFDIIGVVETSSDFLDRITKLVTISLKTDNPIFTQPAAQYLSYFLTSLSFFNSLRDFFLFADHPEHVDHFLESELFTTQSLCSALLSKSPDLLCLIASCPSTLATDFLSANTPQSTLPVLLSPCLTAQLRTFYIHLATIRPTLLASLRRNPQFQIMDWLVRSLYDTARVVPSTENNPRCLSFGTDTADWTAFLGALGTITRQETKKAQNPGTLSLHTSVLGLLILLSASTDIVFSDAAVSEIARGCGLSEGEVKTILFETPLSFPIPPDWELETHVPYTDDAPSLCASIGPTLLKFNDADGQPQPDPSKSILTVILVVDTLRCLVNVFNTVNPTFIRHPSFSPSLTQTPTMPSFWKTQPIATTLPALRTFTVQLIMLASSALIQQILIGLRHRLSIGVATVLHLLPHLDAASKPSALVFIMNQLSNFRGSTDQYLSKICHVVLDLALTDSYRTPTTLLRLTKQLVSASLPARPSSSFGGGFLPPQNELAASISDQMDTAEGEQRWMLFTELICTSTNLSTDTIEKMLLEAENDDQMRVVLSSLALGAVQLGSQGVSFSDEVQTRLLRCAGQTNNVELASHAWSWIEKGCQLPTRQSMHGRMVGRMEASEEMMTLLLKVLGDLNNEGREEKSEGDEEGAAETEKERKTVIQYCLQILSRQIIWMNADSTPFVPLLISLMQNADVQIICTLIEVFVGISTRTSNSANPISLSTIDVPVASQPFPVTQSLLSFVSSFLLKSILAGTQSSLSPMDPFTTQLQPLDEPVEQTIRRMWQNLEGDQSGTGESLMKRMIEIGSELLESSVQARKDQSSPLHHVTSLLTPQSNSAPSPSQILIALFTALFTSPNRLFTIDALCRLSEVLNRLVEAMLKTSSDCVSGEDEYMSVQSFFSTISSTLMHPLVAVARKEWAARPSLSNLLHSISTLLIRHDSSLSELNRYAEQIHQGMERGDGRERRNHQQHPSLVDMIMSTLTEEGVEDRVDMTASNNQRYLQFLGANAIPMVTGMGIFGRPVVGYPFGIPQMANPFGNAQMANPFGNPQFGDQFGGF